MADGYAQATGRPAFLNLHTSAGLGNAIGNLTNAQANGTPLVVTAGQQDLRHIVTEPLLSGDLVGLARPVSKWAHEVRTVGELGRVMRRAFHDASSAPTGPVFVSIPMNLLDESTDAAVPTPSVIERRTVAAGVDELADLLASAERSQLAIVAADEVAASGAMPALVELAEALGVAVFGAPLHSNLVFPVRHPLWQGDLAPAAASINATLSPYRRVLFVGGRAFKVYPYTPGPAVPDHVELLHLSPDAHQLGRTWPVRLGLQGDPRATLDALVPLVRSRVDAAASAQAVGVAREASDRRVAALEARATERYDPVPMHPMAAAHALMRALPPESIVVDEAITTGNYVRGFHHVSTAGTYYFCRGGGLGWGMPAALGVSLGRDRSPVLCVVGDGSAMYSPQALWTAAHEQLPVVFAVVNNRQYLILKNALRRMEGDSVRTGNYVGMDLVDPPIDFLTLARSMGVEATMVNKADDVAGAVRAAWDSGRPHLLELPIAAA
jgi:benzoylformate decarboxylase